MGPGASLASRGEAAEGWSTSRFKRAPVVRRSSSASSLVALHGWPPGDFRAARAGVRPVCKGRASHADLVQGSLCVAPGASYVCARTGCGRAWCGDVATGGQRVWHLRSRQSGRSDRSLGASALTCRIVRQVRRDARRNAHKHPFIGRRLPQGNAIMLRRIVESRVSIWGRWLDRVRDGSDCGRGRPAEAAPTRTRRDHRPAELHARRGRSVVRKSALSVRKRRRPRTNLAITRA